MARGKKARRALNPEHTQGNDKVMKRPTLNLDPHVTENVY